MPQYSLNSMNSSPSLGKLIGAVGVGYFTTYFMSFLLEKARVRLSGKNFQKSSEKKETADSDDQVDPLQEKFPFAA